METLEIPPAASNAVSMATRLDWVASELWTVGIKPVSMQVGTQYLWGMVGAPEAADGVAVQVVGDEFDRLADRWQLVVDDDVLSMNRRASGLVDGVAVFVFAGRQK